MRSKECEQNNPWIRPREWWQRDLATILYDPALWFYYRMIEVAVIDALTLGEDGRPTDEALLARDWIACSEAIPPGAPYEFVSFPECCQRLGLKVDVHKVALLKRIDQAADFDLDELWARLEEISANEPKDDPEPLFEAFRCVPALDQMALFA
jgi:hypothetical protein